MRFKIYLLLFAIVLSAWALFNKSIGDNGVVTHTTYDAKAQFQPVFDIEALLNPGKFLKKTTEDNIEKSPDVFGAMDYVKRDMMAIRQSDDGAICVNPKQKFNVSFPADGGFVLTRPSDNKDGTYSWKVGLVPVAWGLESALTPIGGVVKHEITGNDPAMPDRLENHFSSGLTEWLVNRDEGVEQGFTILSAPEGLDASNGKLLVSLKTIGGTVAVSSDSVGLRAEDGAQVVSYGKLLVADASGRKLPANFIPGVDNTSLSIEVNASGASFPVIIDPLATSSSWSATGEAAGDLFGASASTAGDVNGDGYSDVIVGAYRFNSFTGKVYVFHGSASGISVTPAWTAVGEVGNDWFGVSVSTAGDVNGDGYSDVIVSANGYNSSTGKVYVFHGSASGITGTAASPVWSAIGEASGDTFGGSLAGDVNGDGYSDVIAGANKNNSSAGKVYVFHGSASGITGTAASPVWSAIGEASGDTFGGSVSSAGDVNGDGYCDIIIGAYENSSTGKVYVFHGSASGITGTAASPAWSVAGETSGDRLGCCVSTAGDVNGDGYCDIIAGAYRNDGGGTNSGKAYVFYGSGSGITGTAASPAWSVTGQNAYDYFGWSVSSAGDVNGDGYSDVIVGAYGYNSNTGKAYIYNGSASGIAGTSASPAWSAVGQAAGDCFGWSVSSAGDVNGDGYGDIIVGAYLYDENGTDCGKAYIFHGSASGIAATPAWTGVGETANSWFGFAVSTAGDVNGDGYSDIIVGAYRFGGAAGTDTGKVYVFHGSAMGITGTVVAPAWSEEGQTAGEDFGVSISSGDVNGDGYSDIIIGSAGFNGAAGSNTGKAYVFHGSSSGIVGTAASPAWSTEGEFPDDTFGDDVSTAGDVNGDGYSDVIIGAGGYNSYTGKVYLFHGSTSGITGTAAVPAWSAVGEAVNDRFGSISTAGDVNGDGYSDIIIGAFFNGEAGVKSGKVYVFHGSVFGITGTSTTPAWSAVGQYAGDYFGFSVSTAGDVNGDGYSDVIVGAYFYDEGVPNTGKAYVFHGSPSGITGTSASPAGSVTGETSGDRFGFAVSTVGDVNGDGYSDVIVGAYSNDSGGSSAGKAYAFYGCGGGGLSITPRQLKTNSSPIPNLGMSDSKTSFKISAKAKSYAGRTKAKLQWEVKPLGTSFNGSNLGKSTSWTDTTVNGITITETISGLTASTPYHWRARFVYSNPTLSYSHWFSTGNNAWNEADFRSMNQYVLTYNAGAHGSITGTTPQTVNQGASGSIVSATPETGYHFVKWSDDVMTAYRTDMNVTGNKTVTATFAIDTFTITASAGANGSISPSGAVVLEYGSVQSFVIAPATGYHVNDVLIDGSSIGAATGYTFTNVSSDHTISATFAINPYSLTYTAGEHGSITGTTSQTVNYGGSGSEVTAVPDANYHFVKWSDNVMTAARTDTNVSGNITVTANFAIDTYTLTYNAVANGAIIGTTPQTVNHGASGLTVTAMPDAGYHFVSWDDGVLTASRTDDNVTGNKTVSATFAAATSTAVLTMAVNGSGSVSPAVGTQTVDTQGTTPITATADAGNSFVNWSVNGSALVADANDANTTVTLSDDATVTANFTNGTLTTLVNGTPVLGIDGDEGGMRIYKITLPEGQTFLQAGTWGPGATGDCDLYIRNGKVPTLSSYDAKSTNEGWEEQIALNDPAAGDWYVMIYALKAYSGVNLTVAYDNATPRVTSLHATQGAFSDRIRLTWAGVTGIESYQIWRSDVNNVELAEQIGVVTAPTVSYDDMLPANNSYKYYYWVRDFSGDSVGGFSDYAYGTITDGSVIDLKNGTAKMGITGAIGSMRTYRINVPTGQSVLEVIVSGGTGDCDINVGIGESGSRRYSVRSSTCENIQYENPEAGNYYINIYAKTAYSGVTLLARYTNLAPLTPTAFVASKGTFPDRVLLTWTASSCATSYEVYRALKVGTTVPKFTDAGPSYATVAGTEYEDTDAEFGVAVTPNIYYYWVKAVNPKGSSKETAGVSGNIMTAPTAPGTIAASNGTYFDKIRVTWSKMANVTSYEVYRTTTPNLTDIEFVNEVEASNLASYTVDDVDVPLNTATPTKYYYWILAVNKVNGKETFSIKTDYGYVSNKGPTTITATKGTIYDKVRVTWTAVAGATSYDVYRDGAFLENTASSPYEDSLGNTDSQKYKVKAKYGAYESAFSPEASGYAGTAPATLAAPVIKSASINLYNYVLLTWGEVAKADTYRIYRSDTNIFPEEAGFVKAVSGLTSNVVAPANAKFYYWVKAANGAAISNPSASKAGIAAADATASFDDPKNYPTGETIAVAGSGTKGTVKYYSIDVPAGTTRLIATLSGATTPDDDCDVYAKLGSYPTTAAYNAKGVENKTNEVLAVSNPSTGMWYLMLYGAGTAGYTARTLTVACYNAADIYLTTVPANDLSAPFTATFKGKVVDASGIGIAGLTLMARSPITGLNSYLTAKTDAKGVFSYSELISTEGEHTFDFFFTTMPDLAKGTASHTVFTKNTSLYTSDFDFSAYLRATIVDLNAADTLGMQAFLSTSNCWDDEAIDTDYQSMWIDKTIGAVQTDTALLGKLDSGLYLFLYGVEGAGAGNDTANKAGASGSIPVSGLSPVPFVVHVGDGVDKTAVLSNLVSMGIIDDTTRVQIDAGKVGVVAIASFSAAGDNISLSASEQLNLLANIANNNLVTLPGVGGKYSNVLTKQFEVSVGTTAGDRKINVITSSFIPDMTVIVEDE